MGNAWNLPPVVEVTCPPLRNYPPAIANQMAKELRALRSSNPKAVTPGVVRDYATLRESCRIISSPAGTK